MAKVFFSSDLIWIKAKIIFIIEQIVFIIIAIYNNCTDREKDDMSRFEFKKMERSRTLE